MDELKVIANNHLLMKRYSEAIKAAEKIINLALEVKMDSIIREQEEFITKIYKIVETDKLALIILDDFEQIKKKYQELSKKNKFQEAHQLIEEFKEKYNEFYDLTLIDSLNNFLQKEKRRWDRFRNEESSIKLLEPLEIQFNSYIHTNNITLAEDSLEKAKKILENVSLDYIIDKWKNFEIKYSELKSKYELKLDFEKKVETLSNLTEEYKFQEANSLLSELMTVSEQRGFIEYKDILSAKKRNIEDAKGKYEKLLGDIRSLENQVKDNINKAQYDSAMEKCSQIIKIARFIGEEKYLRKYKMEKEIIEGEIRDYNRFLLLKDTITKEANSAVEKINQDELIEALEKYKSILNNIQEYLEEKE
jgi:hypothetical protein